MLVKLSRGIVNSKDQVLPRNMKAYFANPKNKDNLNNFVFNELESLAQQMLTESKSLALAGGFSDHERAVSVSSGKKEDLLEVFFDQQEADTRIMLQILTVLSALECPLQSFGHLKQTSLY